MNKFCGKIFFFSEENAIFFLSQPWDWIRTRAKARVRTRTRTAIPTVQTIISMFKPFAVIVASLHLPIPTEAFPRLAFPGRATRYTTRRPIPNHVVARGWDNSLVMTDTRLPCLMDDNEEPEAWTLKEDWALMDNLPKFTVSSSTETRTFWTQLWSENTILFSTKQPEELYKRVQELDLQEIAEMKLQSDEKDQKDETTRSLTFGPSPPVLENWKLEDGESNRVVGQIGTDGSGQRTIWFHYHVIGRLEGDPFADTSSGAVSLFPGGYIEAVGGRIYELGQPMLLEDWGVDSLNAVKSMPQEHSAQKSTTESSIFSKWWIPGSTAAISALVSSTILSACIGYGAGLAIISDSSHHPTTTPPTPTMLTVESVLAGPASQSSSLSAGSRRSASNADQTASTEELKTRTEYRILREERLLQRISERLDLDKQNLKQLEERQQQEQSSSQLRP